MKVWGREDIHCLPKKLCNGSILLIASIEQARVISNTGKVTERDWGKMFKNILDFLFSLKCN